MHYMQTRPIKSKVPELKKIEKNQEIESKKWWRKIQKEWWVFSFPINSLLPPQSGNAFSLPPTKYNLFPFSSFFFLLLFTSSVNLRITERNGERERLLLFLSLDRRRDAEFKEACAWKSVAWMHPPLSFLCVSIFFMDFTWHQFLLAVICLVVLGLEEWRRNQKFFLFFSYLWKITLKYTSFRQILILHINFKTCL